jgi:hypothetical protein
MWRDDGPAYRPEARSDALKALVATLQESHNLAQRDVRRRLATSQTLRDHNLELREQILNRQRRRRPAP